MYAFPRLKHSFDLDLVGVIILQVFDLLGLEIVDQLAQSSLLGIVAVEGIDLTL